MECHSLATLSNPIICPWMKITHANRRTYMLYPRCVVLELGGHRARRQRRMLQHAGDIKSNDVWTHLDVRDAARAFRLGGEVPLEGHHRLLLAALDSWARDDIRVLVRRHYPNPASHVEHLNPEASLYTTRRAEEVLGFVPQHSWRDVPELNDKSHI
jgi:hypothetical protein